MLYLHEFDALGACVLLQGRVQQVDFQQVVVPDMDMTVAKYAVKLTDDRRQVEALEDVVTIQSCSVLPAQ